MTDVNLSQTEADHLIAMEKHSKDPNVPWEFPVLGGKVSIPLVSVDNREEFLLDIHRGRIDLAKRTYQNRARQIIPLVRIDLDGAPHRNPDGAEVPCPHLHRYREDYGDKWAVPLPPDGFPNLGDPDGLLSDFFAYCNITRPPVIDRGLF